MRDLRETVRSRIFTMVDHQGTTRVSWIYRRVVKFLFVWFLVWLHFTTISRKLQGWVNVVVWLDAVTGTGKNPKVSPPVNQTVTLFSQLLLNSKNVFNKKKKKDRESQAYSLLSYRLLLSDIPSFPCLVRHFFDFSLSSFLLHILSLTSLTSHRWVKKISK